MQLRMWTTLAGAGLALGAGQAAGAERAEATPYPNGTFEHALEKMFDGEGGEEGVGMTDLSGGRFSVPALTDAQIALAVGGNTIRSANRLAVHLKPDGQVEGWTLKWTKTQLANCAGPRAEGYAMHDGECIASTRVSVAGPWSASGDKLCLPGVFASPFDFAVPARRCYSVALAINSILVFDERGKLVRRPMSLMRGDVRGPLPE